MVEANLVNVILMGLGFLLLYSASQTMDIIMKTFLESVKIDEPNFNGEAYHLMGYVYFSYSIFLWFAPSAIVYLGPRGAMLCGAIIYCCYFVIFMYPIDIILLVGSFIIGIGSALLWTGQGIYFSRCSTEMTISRNSGIFWSLYQLSNFVGNIYLFLTLDEPYIRENVRKLITSVIIAFAVFAIIFFSCLRHALDNSDPTNMEGAVKAFFSSVKLLKNWNFLLLLTTMFYTGQHLAFITSIYASAVGFTHQISNTPTKYVGLVGIFIGFGEVLTSLYISWLGVKFPNIKISRSKIVFFGFISHLFSYIAIGINLPDNSPFKETYDTSILNPPQKWLALLSAFLLGVGDSCFNTQLLALVGIEFVKNSAGAFALLNFIESVGTTVCFLYSASIGLILQLIILQIAAVIAIICFTAVELYGLKKDISE